MEISAPRSVIGDIFQNSCMPPLGLANGVRSCAPPLGLVEARVDRNRIGRQEEDRQEIIDHVPTRAGGEENAEGR